jgi:dTDP-4-dehydrorhamnose reductase
VKILLLGKNGQVGHELRRTLLPHGLLITPDRQVADLSFPQSVRELLHREKPDLIVNAAAYTAVDKAEEEESVAHLVNADSVGELADYAQTKDALLVHYSTDYVFDGTKQGAYTPDDITNPQSAYGRTKLAGEEIIKQSGCPHMIFRTSWVYGVHGNNFVKTILRYAAEREELNVVANQHGIPTSAEFIADVTALAIHAYRSGSFNVGLYHLTPSGKTTWYGLATYVIEQAITQGAKLMLQGEGVKPIPADAYPTPAKRPANSVLDSSMLQKALSLQFPAWQVYVERVVDELVTHHDGIDFS